MFNRAKHTKNFDDLNKYKAFRNKVTKSIREAKTKAYNEKLSNKLKTGSLSFKDWWNTLKCSMKPQRSSVIPTLSKDSNIITNNKEKATLFNKYFTS